MTDKDAQFYINKRMDAFQTQMDRRFDSIEELLREHVSVCIGNTETVSVRVGKLEGFKNRALGAIAIFVFLLALWEKKLI